MALFQRIATAARALGAGIGNQPRPVHELLVLDDVFPHRLSAFRITEYNELLGNFQGAAVYSSAATFPALGETRSFEAVREEYAGLYPEFADRVLRFDPKRKVEAGLCYLMFLNNAAHFLPYLEKCGIPFVLELYPGGGFHLHDPESDRKLRLILSSPLLRGIIVTQKITRDYLVETMGYPAQRVELIYGGVFMHGELAAPPPPRRYFGRDKERCDVCFVAHKYTPRGRDKGYDVFVESARLLAQQDPRLHFHVVGPFGPEDVELGELEPRITFYGCRTTDFFPSFYREMDMIVSPNIPFVLRPGAFDGFPTGACMEALLCGVALFCCDELKLNPFAEDAELVIIPHDAAAIAQRVASYCQDPERLSRLGRAGQQRARELFSRDSQIEPRLRVLRAALAEGERA